MYSTHEQTSSNFGSQNGSQNGSDAKPLAPSSERNQPTQQAADLVSADQLAARLGKSKSQIRRLVNRRKLPRPFKIGHTSMWTTAQIENWIASQVEGGAR